MINKIRYVVAGVLLTISAICGIMMPGNTAYPSAKEPDVYLDMDVTPEAYDTGTYTRALCTVYLEGDRAGTRQELSLYTDRENPSGSILIQEEERTGTVIYTFLNTWNAVGDVTRSFQDSFVKEISIVSINADVVVTVTYDTRYIQTSLQDEDGILASFSSADYSLKLRLPEGLTKNDVKDTDYYYKNMFLLELPGKWKDFYKEHPVLANNHAITSVKTDNKGSSTRITVKTSRLQGYQISEKSGYLIVRVDDPRKIYDNIVVLDAGHGGKDKGATHRGTKEKNINLKIIYTLAKQYFNSPDSTVKAYWTRRSDTFISLYARSRFASQVGADMFISLHMNSARRVGANGMEVYYSTDNNRTASSGLSSRILAQRMHRTLDQDLSIPSRGVKKAGFYVMRYNTVPAILIELGFLSGNRDYAKLVSSSYQKKAAKSIYQCVSDIFEGYPTGR